MAEYAPTSSRPVGESSGDGGYSPTSSQRIGGEQDNDSIAKNTLDVLSEFAASANKSVTEFIDFIGLDNVNAILSLAGSETRVPTLTGALDKGIPGIGSPTRGGHMEEGVPRSIVRGAGTAAGAAGGLVSAGPRNLAKAGDAALEFLGAGTGTAKAIPGAIANAVDPSGSKAESARHLVPGRKAKRDAADLPIKRESGDVEAAGYKQNPDDPLGKPIIDSKAQATLGQGFDPGFISMLKNQNKRTKDQIINILKTAQRGQTNLEYRHRNRPLNIVGQSLLDRVNVVKKARAEAGKDVGATAKALKGQMVDPRSAVNNFIESLDGMGIKYDPATAQFDFSASDIRGLGKVQAPIKRIIKIMTDYPPGHLPDAYEIHTLKRIIDEGVNYAKKKQGLGGNAERVLKGLRHDLDGLLDGFSPAYDDANKRFASAAGALDQMQDAVGRKIDFSSPNAASALGTKSRTLGSNYASRVPLVDAIDSMDDVVKQYKTPSGKNLLSGPGVVDEALDDNLVPQIEAISQIEKLIGTAAPNSFFGDIEKAATRAGEASRGSFTGVASDVATAAYKKARGKNDERAIQYLIDLLEDQPATR